MRFERVVVPALGPGVVDVVTLLLAQSVAIDYYEEDLKAILRDLDQRRPGRRNCCLAEHPPGANDHHVAETARTTRNDGLPQDLEKS